MKVIDAPVLTSTIEGAVFVVCRLALGLRLTFLSRSQTAVVFVCACMCVTVVWFPALGVCAQGDHQCTAIMPELQKFYGNSSG